MEYKLPPLPDLLEKAITHFAQAVHYSDTNGRIGAANNLRKEIKAYAIAAIEAQGVQAFRTSFAYDVGFKDGQQAAKKSDGCGRCADRTKPCDITGSSCAADAIESQASAVQHEPVAWMHKGGHVQVRAPYLSDEAVNGYSTNGQWTPLYTHPAQQAKPQPDPLHDDIQSVLFEVEQAIQNGCCPWQVEAAFEAYEAARRLQQPAHGIQGS